MESSQLTISSVVFIVSLIVPGIIFKRFYFQGQFTKQFGAGPFADRLITSIFWGIFVQIITILTYSKFFDFSFLNVKESVDTAYSKIAENKIPDIVYQHLLYILGYLGFSVVMAIVLGSLCHNFIRTFKLDIRFSVLRFANRWNYLIRGDILLTKEFKGSKKGKVLTTMVDVLIADDTEKNKMVTGFLSDYIISDKTGELETIYLTAAQKYSYSDKKFKDIPGDCLIIPYSRIIDMNIRYNIKIVNNIKKKKFIFNIITSFLLIALPILVAYPWYFDVSILNKILAILFSIFSWLLFITLISTPFQIDSTAKLKGATIWWLVLFMIIFLFVTLLLLHIIPLF